MAITRKGKNKQIAKLKGENAGLKQHMAMGTKPKMPFKGKAKIAAIAVGANIGLGVTANEISDGHRAHKAQKAAAVPARKKNYPTTRTHSFSPNT